MPSDMINKVVKKCDKSKDDVEELWEEAKKQAEENEQGDNYAYITGIFKQMLGKDCLSKLGWEKNEEQEMTPLRKYLLDEAGMQAGGGAPMQGVAKKIDTHVRDVKRSTENLRRSFMEQDSKGFQREKKEIQDRLREMDRMFKTLYQ